MMFRGGDTAAACCCYNNSPQLDLPTALPPVMAACDETLRPTARPSTAIPMYIFINLWFSVTRRAKTTSRTSIFSSLDRVGSFSLTGWFVGWTARRGRLSYFNIITTSHHQHLLQIPFAINYGTVSRASTSEAEPKLIAHKHVLPIIIPIYNPGIISVVMMASPSLPHSTQFNSPLFMKCADADAAAFDEHISISNRDYNIYRIPCWRPTPSGGSFGGLYGNHRHSCRRRCHSVTRCLICRWLCNRAGNMEGSSRIQGGGCW